MPKRHSRKNDSSALLRRPRRPKLHWTDKRVQSVMEFLWGTWALEQLERRIARRFPLGRARALKRVAQRICDMHCCSMGYTGDDIARQLRKLLPREELQ